MRLASPRELNHETRDVFALSSFLRDHVDQPFRRIEDRVVFSGRRNYYKLEIRESFTKYTRESGSRRRQLAENWKKPMADIAVNCVNVEITGLPTRLMTRIIADA